MANKISQRLLELVNALPVKPDSKILEIGCGPGAAAREIAGRLVSGKIMAIDRSEKAIHQAIKNSAEEIASRKLCFRVEKIENFSLQNTHDLFDFAFAFRVGALDGRHPEIEQEAFKNVFSALIAGGKLFLNAEDDSSLKIIHNPVNQAEP